MSKSKCLWEIIAANDGMKKYCYAYSPKSAVRIFSEWWAKKHKKGEVAVSISAVCKASDILN